MGRVERPADREADEAAASGPAGDRRRGGGDGTVSRFPVRRCGPASEAGDPLRAGEEPPPPGRLRVPGAWKGAGSAGSPGRSGPLKHPALPRRPRAPAASLQSRGRSNSSSTLVTSKCSLLIGPFSGTDISFHVA